MTHTLLFFKALFLAALAFVLVACGTTADITVDWSQEKLYQQAKQEQKNGAFDKAIGYFEKLETRAAGTPLAQQAQIEKAYSLYKSNEPAKAMVTLDRFSRLHPTSPLLDYALYLKGLVNFNDNLGFLGALSGQNVTERDPKASKDSYDAFADLLRRFPQSKYADDAKARMTYIVNALAENEFSVAKYYFSQGAYLAAANRAQSAITDYPRAPSNQLALEVLIQSYDKLGLIQLRDDAKRIMQKSYPGNRLAAK